MYGAIHRRPSWHMEQYVQEKWPAGRDGLAVIAGIHKTSLQEMEVVIIMYNGIL